VSCCSGGAGRFPDAARAAVVAAGIVSLLLINGRVLDCIKAGTRDSEARYAPMHLASPGQASVRGVFKTTKSNVESEEDGKRLEKGADEIR
jgi:hypothetical protein